MKEHYAKRLKRENTLLRKQLEEAIDALRLIPLSRLDKYAREPDNMSTLAYRKCAQEVDRLSIAAVDRITDMEFADYHPEDCGCIRCDAASCGDYS